MNKTAAFPVVLASFLMLGLSVIAEETPTVAEVLSFGAGTVAWRPDWPAELPPDAFILHGAGRAASIVVTAEGEEKTEKTDKAGKPAASDYSARWSSSGAVLAKPFFSGGAAYALSLEYTPEGRLKRYLLEATAADKQTGTDAGGKTEKKPADKKTEKRPDTPKKGVEKKKGDTAPSAAVSLFYEADGSLMRAERAGTDGVESSIFKVAGDRLEELAYDTDGKAVGRALYFFMGQALRSASKYEEDGKETPLARFDYDSGGRVTRLESADASVEALYDEAGRPVRTLVSAGKDSVRSERRFQWDHRGFLVRESSTAADGKTLETAYSYRFNSSGEWVERNSINYVERFGITAPEKGVRVLRKITYR